MASYTVQSGDSLSKIAFDFYGDGSDANVQIIFQANREVIGNDPNFLQPGQVLFIPQIAFSGVGE